MKKLKFETILIIAAIAGVIYYFYNKNKDTVTQNSSTGYSTDAGTDSGTNSSSDAGTDSGTNSSNGSASSFNAVDLALGGNIAVANLGSNRVRPQVRRQSLSFAQAASRNSFFGRK